MPILCIGYRDSTSQSNQAHINALDIPIYDEIPENQYEKLSAVKKTNLHSNNDDDANQDNESYVSQLVNQQDQDYGSYVSQVNQDYDSYDNLLSQQSR